MNNSIVAVFIAALLALPALHLPAMADEDSVIILEESVITATRTESDILEAPAHVSVINQADIEQMGAKNVADLLAVQAGISIRDYGPEGSLSTVSIRGSSSEGVLVLVDGARMNDSRAGGVDLSLIPLHSVEKIEIVRGGTSALYGADAVGGIINIITKKEADNRLKITVENGSYIPRNAVAVYEGSVKKQVHADLADLFDTQTVTVSYSKKLRDVNLLTSGSFTRANNAYTWNDTEFVDGYRRRINADMTGGDLSTGLSFPFLSGNLDMSGQLGYQTKGAPGPLSWLSTDATQTDTLAHGSVHYNTRHFFTDALTFDVKGSYKFTRLTLDDPDPEPTYSIDDTHRTNALSFDATQELLFFDAFTLVYGFNINYDLAKSTKIGTEDRVSGGLFLESPIYLTSKFTLTPAVRLDAYSDFPSSFNFKLSGVYALTSRTSFKTSVAKSYRAPTLNDLYWPYTPTELMEGNPDLNPETGYSAEAGVSTIHDAYSMDLFLFTRYMIDEIKWNPGSDNVWRPENIGESFYPGLELNGRLKLVKNLWLSASSTFIYSFVLKDASGNYTLQDDKRVLNVPIFTMDVGIEYRGPKNLFSVGGQYKGKRYYKNPLSGNIESLDGYFVLNTLYKRRLSDTFSISIATDNLLNATYEELYGYIMPPLFIRTGVEAVF